MHSCVDFYLNYYSSIFLAQFKRNTKVLLTDLVVNIPMHNLCKYLKRRKNSLYYNDLYFRKLLIRNIDL